MNLPALVEVLEKVGVKNPIVCANVNKIGFRMCGGIDAYRDVIASGRCRPIAMSVFASGAIRPQEAIEWVCDLKGLESIVFGASSAGNIRQTTDLIRQRWGMGAARQSGPAAITRAA
jgi:phosphoribosylformimino-5-aminoimidazole carboxamide ribonucleotide (ProFAR) isomerase